MANKLIWTIVGFLAVWFVLAPMAFGAVTGIALLLVTVFVLSAVAWVSNGKIPVFPTNKGTALKVMAITGIGAFAFGAFAQFGFPGFIDAGSFGTATVTAPITATTTTTTLSGACSGMQINPDRIGESGTVTLLAKDQENNDPQTKGQWLADARAYVQGVERTLTGTSTGATFTAKVGEDFVLYGGNGTTYVDKFEGCVSGNVVSFDVPVRTVEAAGDLAITCYDSSGTALTGAGNVTQKDYDVTLGADQEEVISCKIKVATADAAYNLLGMATFAANDIDSLELNAYKDKVCQSGHASCNNAPNVGFASVAVPEFLRNLQISDDTYQAGDNITGDYDNAYTLNQPILLREFDEVEYQYTITAGSTNPAVSNDDYSASDVGILCYFDGVWDQGSDGNEYMTWYTRDSSEANVGVTEETTLPLGKNSCAVIEGI